ncbi:hypothetical protein BGZ61DRAFT_591638 [Ilyonectria robusta]|uniref:uncharacterized protein n=1 Tax=Ilyonectria robusta TaxID=1079257 RepID=UPI001E8DAAB7|nr:uncharacterized protein BGZ61DRAFT_591638 [Ilyonectria robusta]KAH8673133.1 hypothetical protein BGZ61DRAFT_591638 [Ilyonectria robusta]
MSWHKVQQGQTTNWEYNSLDEDTTHLQIILPPSPSQTMADFKLTRPHVLKAFEPLQETDDIARRNSFFSDSMVPDVKWTITGQAHSLVGTRNSIQEHSNMSFDKIDKRLEGPI